MFTRTDILTKAWLVKEVVNLVLLKQGLTVHKMFLCGSYASGKATHDSDIDFIVELEQVLYPNDMWNKIQEIHTKLNDDNIHVIFGTEAAAASLASKNGYKNKSYAYKEILLDKISLSGENNVNSSSPSYTIT